MDLSLEPGKYVLAVSGGVDSVSLLHAATQLPDVELVVAHFDHGIRAESADDARFVAGLARTSGLRFYTERVELGANASEDCARRARYDFLRHVQSQVGATAIITAHHQDDLLETAIFNLLRGTGRHGLTSLRSRPGLLRPLLGKTKEDIKAYALKQGLSWHEDTTNHNERYARNYIRNRLLVSADLAARQQLLALIGQTASLNGRLDAELMQLLDKHCVEDKLDRRWFNSLPHAVAKEVMAEWLRRSQLADFDRPTLERLVVHCKTRPVGKRADVRRQAFVVVGRSSLALQTPER